MSYYPLFHIYSKNAFINDPNGLLYESGRYHVFYQCNPAYPCGKRVGWAHLISHDLVHFNEVSPALIPDCRYDRNGCYSGSAILKNKRIYLVYSGNTFNHNGERETYQCLAISDDVEKFEKYKGNPLLSGPAKGYTAHFRDPKIFTYENGYAFVIGTQTVDKNGRALLYFSRDIVSWKYGGELMFNDQRLSRFGYMWECPNLFNIYDEIQKREFAVLLFCPQGIEPEGLRYQNRYECGYVVASGQFDGTDTFRKCTMFEELDRGFEFYAPQVFNDGRRTLLIGWMGMPEEENQPSKQENWMHCLTVPRTLCMRDKKLFQWPIEELNLLHGVKRTAEPMCIENMAVELNCFVGDCYDMTLEFKIAKTKKLTVSIRRSSTQNIRITYCEGIISVDRRLTGYAPGNPVRQAKIKNMSKLMLRILSDRSSIELFINGGEEVFSFRAYLNPDAVRTAIQAEGSVVLSKALFYEMSAQSNDCVNFQNITCERNTVNMRPYNDIIEN